MLFRVFNSCAAEGTTSISKSIFAFVNASEICKISKERIACNTLRTIFENNEGKQGFQPIMMEGLLHAAPPKKGKKKKKSAQKF